MFVGIDVAKAELVVAIHPTNERWTVANDERGVRTLETAPAAVRPIKNRCRISSTFSS